MSTSLAPEITPYSTLHTIEVPHPFRVRLEGVTPRDREVVTVYDQVVIGDRCIVRSASGEGYWHVAAARDGADALPLATFEPHKTVSFSFPCR